MTATGAEPEAGMKYAKIIGEKEKAVESVKFDFLGVYRPAVILGNFKLRNRVPRIAETGEIFQYDKT